MNSASIPPSNEDDPYVFGEPSDTEEFNCDDLFPSVFIQDINNCLQDARELYSRQNAKLARVEVAKAQNIANEHLVDQVLTKQFTRILRFQIQQELSVCGLFALHAGVNLHSDCKKCTAYYDEAWHCCIKILEVVAQCRNVPDDILSKQYIDEVESRVSRDGDQYKKNLLRLLMHSEN